jgi:glycosyltransferase involved in cell wall biosynthesis
MPTIGRTEYLASALGSLGQQTLTSYELLLLDNASGPEAKAIIGPFVASHPNARVLRVEERVPMFANFNRGVREARGEYVIFFHDDDVYEPTFLERHIAVLDAHPRAGFAGGNFDVIDAAGRTTARHRGIRATGIWSGRYFIERLFRRGRADVPTPGLAFRRAALAPVEWDERLPMNWGDFTVLMRIAERWDVAVLTEPLYAWRIHGQNSSRLALSCSLAIRTGVLRHYCAEYLARHPDERRFVARLEAHMERDLRRSLVWGWLAAPDAKEAGDCRTLLQSSHPVAADALRFLESAGLTVARRRALAPAARYLATLVRA